MNTLKLWMWLVVAGTLAGSAAAQNYDQPAAPPPPPPRRHPPAGTLLTDKLIDSVINRVTDQMAEMYGLDADQLLNTRDSIKARFPEWFRQNRDELQSLFVQYLEAVTGDEPPTPEEVAQWAGRVQPLLQEFTGLVDDTTEEMRGYLNDQQQVILEGQKAAMQVATNFLQQRLSNWQAGGYDWKTEWPPSQTFQQHEKERQAQLERDTREARNKAMGLPPDAGDVSSAGGAAAVAKPGPQSRPGVKGANDDWAVYTENFIKRYQLDEAQQNNAHKFLRDQQELRDRYLQRHLDDIKTLEEKQKAAKDEDAKALVKAEYERLNKPVDGYFQRLKDRLETLPRRSQRAAAAQADENSKTTGPASGERNAALKTDQPEANQTKQ
jgi:hypothetical protein